MNLSYDNIEKLYASPVSDPWYQDTAEQEELIRTMYRLKNLIDHVFTMFPPVTLANRLAIVHRVRDAVANAAVTLDISRRGDDHHLDAIMDMQDEPNKEALYQCAEEYLAPIINHINERKPECAV